MAEIGYPRVEAAAVVKGGDNSAHVIPAPSFHGAFECVRPDGRGGTSVVWRDDWHNVVVDIGKQMILNRLFGSRTANTGGCFLALHSATTASNHGWDSISASQVHSYGNNAPLITFVSNAAANSTSASATYGFTASTQTVSGAAVLFYSTNTMSTTVAGGTGNANAYMYSEGPFNGGSRQVQNGDTLNVSLTVSYA
jgi:hypothetical protein